MPFRQPVIAAAAAVAIAVIGLTPAANSAGQDGVANSGELVLFYNSAKGGSLSDFATDKPSLTGYTFIKTGLACYGQAVTNNAASASNLRNSVARVYYSANYSGAYDSIPAGSWANLVKTYNANVSFRWP
jgi:hypothetical protein